MSIKRSSIIPLAILAAGFAIFLSACDFIIASNSSPASPISPAETSNPPPVALPTSTPNLQPTIDALVQQRISEILTPSPRSEIIRASQTGENPLNDAPADAPTPVPVQFPTLAPAANFKAEYYRSGFACTGSMRPTIDCGDEGLFLKPPFQEPLTVGDIISFSPDESCLRYKNQDISKAHRIVGARFESGTTYYTTKGDSTFAPDSCEVTIEQIDGKLVEIKKGVRPQDVIETLDYDFAKERVRVLKTDYQERRNRFEQQRAEYDAQSEEYQLLVTNYQEGRTDYQEVLDFHQGLEEQRIVLNELKDELNSLGRDINDAIEDVDQLYRELFIP